MCTKRIKLHRTVGKSVMFRKAHFWSYDKFFKINTKFQNILSILFSERLNMLTSRAIQFKIGPNLSNIGINIPKVPTLFSLNEIVIFKA